MYSYTFLNKMRTLFHIIDVASCMINIVVVAYYSLKSYKVYFVVCVSDW